MATIYRLFRRYDRMREPWRMLTPMIGLFIFTFTGLIVRLTLSEGLGWMITVVPIFAAIWLRMRYLAH